MDAATLSTSLSAAATGQQVAIGVLRSLEGLDKTLAADLFASIGIGNNFDTHA